LSARSYESLVVKTRAELDLRDQRAVTAFFRDRRPEVVFLAAAKVGGIHANNTSRWEFLYDNLAIQNNVLGCCLEHDVPKVIFFGSSCVYPREAKQPIREDYLLTGALEQTNEPYAIAKIAGLKLVEAANAQYRRDWLSLMPTNLYGPGDNFDLQSSHVLPALIRKFHESKVNDNGGSRAAIKLWGTGRPLREFLHVDDLAIAACDLMEGGCSGLYNVGSGEEISIKELAEKIAAIVGYNGAIEWDDTKPDGTPRKLLDSTRVRATGWLPRISLAEGLRATYEWYLSDSRQIRATVH
jgi:GDP-L-fucose synthase